MKATKKRIRVVILAAVLAVGTVGVGFALSLELSPATAMTGASLSATVATRPFSPIVTLSQAPDAAKLFVLGTVLMALAAVVRRTV